MSFKLVIFTGFSLFIAGILSLLRFRKIDFSFRFFIYYIWIGCINESINYIGIINGYKTGLNSNIYVLISSLLLVTFFKNKNKFFKNWIYKTILYVLILIWMLDTLVFGNINDISSFFRIAYCFTIIFLSINTINRLLITEQIHLAGNPLFILCVTFLVYFIFKALVEAFWIYGALISNQFLILLYTIMIYITLFANAIYALVVLWIPKKQPSLLPS